MAILLTRGEKNLPLELLFIATISEIVGGEEISTTGLFFSSMTSISFTFSIVSGLTSILAGISSVERIAITSPTWAT